MRQESKPARPWGSPGFRPGSVSQSDCASGADGGGLAPQPSRAHPGSSRGCASAASPSMSGERRTRIPAVARPGAFKAVPAPWPVHSPWLFGVRDTPNRMRRADDLNVTAGAAHSLAARPSTLAGSLSLVPQEGVEPSRPWARPSKDRASAYSATGAWSGRRDLNSPYDHGKVVCCR